MKLAATLLLLLSLTAHAEEKKKKFRIPCELGQDLEKEGQDCDANSVFSKAGEACVASVEKAVKDKSAEIALAMMASNLAHTGNGNNAQDSNFAGSASDYAISIASLADLIAAAKIVRNRVDEMQDHLYYPEDFDAPEEVVGDNAQFVDSQECYNEPRQSLIKSLEKVDKQLADLEKSYKAATQRQGVSAGRQSNTGTIGDAAKQPLKGKAAKSAPAIKGKDTPRPESDISGTKEEQH